MKILALDLGTNTGWACGETDKDYCGGGTENFCVKKFDGAGIRYLKFKNWLTALVQDSPRPDVVYFEGVRRHLGVDAAHVYGGMLATMQCVLETFGIPYCALSVQEIKKFATGKGNAKKPDMIAAARAEWPDKVIADDDDDFADALWILELAKSKNPGTPFKDLL